MMLSPFLLPALILQKNLYPISGQRDDKATESFTIPTETGEERQEEEDKKVAEVNENDFFRFNCACPFKLLDNIRLTLYLFFVVVAEEKSSCPRRILQLRRMSHSD